MLGLLLLFDGCDDGFQVKNGKPSIISITGAGKTVRAIPGANVETFRSLDNAEDARVIYAADKKQVYMGLTNMAMAIDSADLGTFSILTSDGTYAADKERVYWFGVELEGADPISFRIIQPPYAIDNDQVYVGTAPVEVHSLKDFEVMEVSSVDSPITNSRNRLVLEKDREYISGWSRDGIAYYWGSSELKGADFESVVILNDIHAKDNTTVYFRGRAINGADADSFVIVGPGSVRGQDKGFEYKSGKQIGRVKK